MNAVKLEPGAVQGAPRTAAGLARPSCARRECARAMAPTDEERKATSPKQGLSPKALAARAAAAKKQAQAAARAKMEQLQEWKDRELEARSDLCGNQPVRRVHPRILH